MITPGHDEGHEFWPPPGWGRRVVWALTAILLAVCALVAFRVLSIDTLALSTKTLLVLFMLLPLPLCFVLVRAYTRMLEDERVKALSEAWLRCENGYVGTPEYQQAQAESTEAALFADRLRIFYDRMQGYVLQQHPELAELYLAIRKIAVREGPAADDKDNFPAEWVAMAARSLAAIELRMAGLNRRAYTLPVFFFAFAYMAGLILMLPAFEMFEAEVVPHWANVTLSFVNTTVVLPLMVVQAGYLGGAAFAAFTIISRVLNRDINPRLFLVASVRLMLAPIGALLLYLSTLSTPNTFGMATSTGLLLLYFVAGGFPFALLIEGAEALFSRLEVGKRRLLAGKRSTTLIEGIGIFVAQRVSEEGVDVIQHLAFCDVVDLARRTRYAERTVADWKDQAILYLLTGDCAVPGRAQPDEATPTLYDLLDVRAGIRCASALLRRVCVYEAGADRRDVVRVRPDIEAFLWQLGLLRAEEHDRKGEIEQLTFLFARFCEDAMGIDPGLRQLLADPATACV